MTKMKPDGGGLRYNAGKVKVELIPGEWIWALGLVLTRGSQKYAERNWERGMKWSYCVGCSIRHVIKFVMGERYDKETGCHHLAMAAWNCLALMSYDMRSIGENDIVVGDTAWLARLAVDPSPEFLALCAQKDDAAPGAKQRSARRNR